MTYTRRVLDDELDWMLNELPAVALDGAKAIGKTSTASARATTVLRLDSANVREAVLADPTASLLRKKPLLLDEWQKAPAVWDAVRRAVDADRSPGQFLLTGSATAAPGTTAHTGAGRVTRVRMRPLALCERGIEVPTVSIRRLFAGSESTLSGHTDVGLSEYVHEILASGFPGLRGLSARALRGELDSYLQNAVDRDIPDQGIIVRRPAVLMDWLRAYAAATSGTASYTQILDAATAGVSDKPARATTATYRDALTQLWLLDPLPAWTAVGREFARLGQTPTHHLADPALTARLLGLTEAKLLDGGGKPLGAAQGTMLGRLFESLATLSIRVMAVRSEATASHLRTRNGDREIDIVLTDAEGRMLAIEVKLGGTITDHDVRHLNWFARENGSQLVDRLVVNTGPAAYRRPDGIAVIPLALLGP